MPEGDTVYRAAQRMDEVLRDQVVTEFDMRVPAFATADLRGERIHGVVPRGKHLLTRIGEWTVHSHLKMEGQWQLYRRGERWRRPAHQARMVLGVESWQAVGFSLGVLELVRTVDEDQMVGHLGPDLLGPDWDAGEAVRRLASEPDRASIVALLDQRNLAGLGNVFANELCFLRGIDPATPIRAVPDLSATVQLAVRLIRTNRDRPERVFTGDMRRGRRTWVYGRQGEPCRRCGTRIRYDRLGASSLTLRDTYWCPSCQPGVEVSEPDVVQTSRSVSPGGPSGSSGTRSVDLDGRAGAPSAEPDERYL